VPAPQPPATASDLEGRPPKLPFRRAERGHVPASPLPLLVRWVRADHPNDPLAPHDLAVAAHLLDRCPDFH